FGAWWPELLRAVTVASSLVALAWLLATRRRADGWRDLTAAPLRTAQLILGLAGAAAAAVAAAVWLVREPGAARPEVIEAGQPMGWAAVLLPAVAAGWQLPRV